MVAAPKEPEVKKSKEKAAQVRSATFCCDGDIVARWEERLEKYRAMLFVELNQFKIAELNGKISALEMVLRDERKKK